MRYSEIVKSVSDLTIIMSQKNSKKYIYIYIKIYNINIYIYIFKHNDDTIWIYMIIQYG